MRRSVVYFFAVCLVAVTSFFVSTSAHAITPTQDCVLNPDGSEMVCAAGAQAACDLVSQESGYHMSVQGTICFKLRNSDNGAVAQFHMSAGGACPANSTNTGSSCTCNSGYTVNGSNTACVSTGPSNCTAGTVLASGYFDIGTNPNKSPAIFACVNGCMATFDGISPAGSTLVGGVKHYFASGFYGSSTTACTAGVDGPSVTSLATVPSPACAAGQVLGTVNGKPTCAASAPEPGASSPTASADPSKSSSATTSTTTTNPDGSTTTTKTTTYQNADGSTGKTTTTTVTQPSGAATSSTANEGDIPNDDSTDEEGEDEGGGIATNTPLPAKPTLYEPVSSGGFAEVWNEKSAALKSTPVFSFVSSLAPSNLGDGGCPSWSIPTGQVLGITVGGSASIPCYVWTFIRLVMVISSLLLARRLIFGG